ncbi:hypothetical protein T11_5455 [Trichinella zimbabwensis]|uniref:Uncharacterized protein n=1 Tax=Trichinella zimbabwensis TaxID=268475 RepID=A0A0V1HDQ7_9BILA|nr:hypothetical protein T11_5455 [Trichinella zimbabwensis]
MNLVLISSPLLSNQVVLSRRWTIVKIVSLGQLESWIITEGGTSSLRGWTKLIACHEQLISLGI